MSTRFRFPKIPEFCLPVLLPVVRFYLSRQTSTMHTVHDLQLKVEAYMQHMIDKTITNLTISGQENLKDGKPHLIQH